MVTSDIPLANNPRKEGALPPQKNRFESWLTREESAHLLGVTVQTIKNYEKKNLLYPQRVPRNINGREQIVVVHDPQSLSALNETLRKKVKHDAATDTSGWLTRNQSTDMLRVSTQTLKNYERQGKLHPIRARREDTRGHDQSVVVYDPKELAKLPRGLGRFSPRETGEIQARCFEMFEQGKSFSEIVVAMRETSDTIHELHERWLDDGGSRLVISDTAKGALETVLGPFADITELVERVIAKCGKPINSP
jgi:hypothetical protein